MFAKKQSIKSIKLGKRMLDPLHLTSLILIETRDTSPDFCTSTLTLVDLVSRLVDFLLTNQVPVYRNTEVVILVTNNSTHYRNVISPEPDNRTLSPSF